MKKIILSVVLASCQLVLFSQTVNIHFKNGQTIEYPSENVEYVDFSAKASDPTVTTGVAIDLGLSVYWASYNVGASSPEEFGEYFSWGETSPKSSYYTTNYSYYDSNSDQIMDIGDNISGTAYDAATVNLGKDWRIPTKEEMKELIDNCSWEWVQISGIRGYKITGRNGNSIFLPAAGCKSDTQHYHKNTALCYSSATTAGKISCYAIFKDGGSYNYSGCEKYRGMTIRPVTSIANPGEMPNDNQVTDKITASFVGGAYSSINGTIQSGSQLSWRFSNNSSESVTLIGIQLINGATNSESGNLLTESVNVAPGETKGYTITVGILGIKKPKIRFTYQYNQKNYIVEAAMPD